MTGVVLDLPDVCLLLLNEVMNLIMVPFSGVCEYQVVPRARRYFASKNLPTDVATAQVADFFQPMHAECDCVLMRVRVINPCVVSPSLVLFLTTHPVHTDDSA